MSRLASFQGPSTPSKTPVNPPDQAPPPSSSKGKKPTKSRQKANVSSVPQSSGSPSRPGAPALKSQGNTPVASPKAGTKHTSLNSDLRIDPPGFTETELHKQLRQTLLEIRSVARRWEEFTKVKGFTSAKEIVDARTLIENALALVPKGGVPSKVVVGPHMQVINEGIRRLEETLANLNVLLTQFNTLIDSLENLYIQAVNDFYGLPSVTPSTPLLNPDVPLYPTSTWSLSRFASVLPPVILPYYALSLAWYHYATKRIASSQLKWEDARMLLAAWKDGDCRWECVGGEPHPGERGGLVCIEGVVLEGGWTAELEDICAVEIIGWR